MPSRSLAGRAAFVLVLASAAAIETVAWRHPGAPVGLGAVVVVTLGAWHLLLSRRRGAAIRRVMLGSKGDWGLARADGRVVSAELVPGSRVLGGSIVLRLRSGRRTHSVWLTERDLPRGELRALAVRLRAAGTGAGA